MDAFVEGDYHLKAGLLGVKGISTDLAARISESVQNYGATLVELPDETWDSSVCIWNGTHWDALVDLWTKEEGPSDLVLHARVIDLSPGFEFRIHLVYVP